ncbi:MAG TPA: sigma-70 family RNA polymerase sigma factor, partial [Clostridia bacterium]|nr:sigma-70 family RNA polymerase sigma factor [Clostridia bacterium]
PKRVRQYREAARPPISLEAPTNDDEGSSSVSEVVADESAAAPSDQLIKDSDNALIKEAFNILSAREKAILSSRFGLENDTPKTLEEIGREFGLTRERIRQIEAQALRKLRAAIGRRDNLVAEEVLSIAE